MDNRGEVVKRIHSEIIMELKFSSLNKLNGVLNSKSKNAGSEGI